MMRRLIPALLLFLATATAQGQAYWNQNLRIFPLRAPVGENPEFMDLNGDGRQDAVKSYIAGGVPILWLDDDGNMKEGDLEGDTVNDCLLVDRDKDGTYDLIVKFADLTGNGVTDMQYILDYPVGGRKTKNHMIVLDDVGDVEVVDVRDGHVLAAAEEDLAHEGRNRKRRDPRREAGHKSLRKSGQGICGKRIKEKRDKNTFPCPKRRTIHELRS